MGIKSIVTPPLILLLFATQWNGITITISQSMLCTAFAPSTFTSSSSAAVHKSSASSAKYLKFDQRRKVLSSDKIKQPFSLENLDGYRSINSSSRSFSRKALHAVSPESGRAGAGAGGLMGSLSTASSAPLETIKGIATLLFSSSSTVPLPLSFLLNSSLFLVLKSKLSKMLTPEGFYHSLALGTMLWHTLGWKGWTTCVLYLFLGSAVTKVKFREKEAMGIAEGRGGRRGPENVWGSAATALLCAAASIQATTTEPFLGITSNLYVLGYVSSLATKLSDTFASEIGKAYGKTTFLITTLERVEPGTEGAVSAEGTAAALFGGSLLPFYALAIGLLPNLGSVGIATIAAFLATNAESVIGATLQGKKGLEWITNEVVNFINTVIGAGIAIASGMLLFGV